MSTMQRVTVSFHGGSVSFDAQFWRSEESLIDEARKRLGPLLSNGMMKSDVVVEREMTPKRRIWW